MPAPSLSYQPFQFDTNTTSVALKTKGLSRGKANTIIMKIQYPTVDEVRRSCGASLSTILRDQSGPVIMLSFMHDPSTRLNVAMQRIYPRCGLNPRAKSLV